MKYHTGKNKYITQATPTIIGLQNKATLKQRVLSFSRVLFGHISSFLLQLGGPKSYLKKMWKLRLSHSHLFWGSKWNSRYSGTGSNTTVGSSTDDQISLYNTKHTLALKLSFLVW